MVEVFLIYIHGLMIEVDHFAVVIADKIEIMNISDFGAEEVDSEINKIWVGKFAKFNEKNLIERGT